MTIEIRQNSGECDLVLAGSWDAPAAVELKKSLSSLPADSQKLNIDASGLDSLPLAAVQVFLAFIRYARSIPKPVNILFDKSHAPQIKLWGLDQAGWEHFFHGH